jgi:alanine racemase
MTRIFLFRGGIFGPFSVSERFVRWPAGRRFREMILCGRMSVNRRGFEVGATVRGGTPFDWTTPGDKSIEFCTRQAWITRIGAGRRYRGTFGGRRNWSLAEKAVGRDSPTVTAWTEFDLGVLKGNLREIRRRVGPGPRIIAAIKANAYGHGAVEMARALAAMDTYALATGSLEEALAIRRSAIPARILILGSSPPDTVPHLLGHDLMPSIDDMATARAVSEAADAPRPVFIKIDCGFGRFGVPVEAARGFIEGVGALPNIFIEGVYTHLPFFDARGRDWARDRHAVFDRFIADLAGAGMDIPVTQAISSSGIAGGLTDGCNAVAPGSLLYGLAPVAPDVGDMSGFRPVLRSIGTRLIHATRRAVDPPPGRDAQYLRHGVTATGIVPLGMNEGYCAAVSGRAAVMLMRGRRVPVLRVCLENTVLDLSSVDEPRSGEKVVALGRDEGEEITLEEMADWGAVSPLGVLISLDRRLPRRYLGGTSD